jgi:hypothetical protein
MATTRSPNGSFSQPQTIDVAPDRGGIVGLTLSSDDSGNVLIAWADQPPSPATAYDQQIHAATGTIPGPLTVTPVPLPGGATATPLGIASPGHGEFVLASAIVGPAVFRPTIVNRYRFG